MQNNSNKIREKKVIVITGPTATGKTALGAALCLAIGGEVISADSMQVYRGMDVGTAKATREGMRGVPHHMLDVCPPGEDFSAARWVEMAAACAGDIFARGKTPVIVGGTGLYIDSLLSGRNFAAAPEDGALRDELSTRYDALGGEGFREELRKIDPDRAEKLHPADKKRLVRAMEVYRLTGRTISQHDEETRRAPPRWPSLRFALDFERREALYARIDRRVDEMLRLGLMEEVKGLLDAGLSPHSTAMQAIGYKEAAAYLAGCLSYDEAAEEIKRASRRYAKRQLTWLRRDAALHWIVWEDEPDIGQGLALVSQFL